MADKILFENEWISLMEKDGWYVYAHESRCEGGALVAIVPYVLGDDGIEKVLGRFEECPAHGDGIALCCITGGVDHGSNPVEAVLKELYEEGGFEATEDLLTSLGTVRPIASSDAIVHLFAIDVTEFQDDREEEPVGDGTKGEEDAYCDWVSLKEALGCKSANMLSCLSRLLLHEDLG